MSNMKPSFDSIYMDLAQSLALRSHCTRAQVGAVLTKDTRIISIGYNGPPQGTHNCDEDFHEEGGCPRDSKGSCSLALHAEQNAIIQAAYLGVTTKEATLFASSNPCSTCSKMIINAGIVRVVCREEHHDLAGMELLKKAGVLVEIKWVSFDKLV